MAFLAKGDLDPAEVLLGELLMVWVDYLLARFGRQHWMEQKDAVELEPGHHHEELLDMGQLHVKTLVGVGLRSLTDFRWRTVDDCSLLVLLA